MVLIYLLPRLRRQYQQSRSHPSGERTIVFVFCRISLLLLQFLMEPYTHSICSIFSLCVESNDSRNQQTIVLLQGFFVSTPAIIQGVVRICEFMDRFIRKQFLNKNFLDFRSDSIENQGIINFSSHNIKDYTTVILSDSNVTFLKEEEEEDTAFCPFFYYVLFIYIQIFYTSVPSNFLVFHISGDIRWNLQLFCS